MLELISSIIITVGVCFWKEQYICLAVTSVQNASAVQTQFNWTQYKLLISISDPDKREYYELEQHTPSL